MIEKDSAKPLAIKNPERRIGTNRSWSIATSVVTFNNLEVLSENSFKEMIGMILLCQKCNIGAVYNNPTVKKLMFLLKLNC